MRFLLIAILSSAFAMRAFAQSNAPTTILLEAEDFSAGGAWKKIAATEAYYFATLANTFHSRHKLLSTPEQCTKSVATFKIEIPTNGFYRIWSRYECPSWWSVEHSIRIRQGGGTVFLRKYGALTNPKLWPFGKGIQPMVDWDWGSGDNIVWEPSDNGVALTKGEALIQIIAEPQETNQPRQRGAARRNIDCIFLTTDVDDGIRDAKKGFYHLMDRHLAQTGECWMRIINPLSQTNLVTASLRVAEHNPYWQKRGRAPERIGAGGEFKGEPKAGDWIAPGDSSPWIPIGQALDTLNMQELTVSFTSRPAQKSVNAIIIFARHGDGRSLLRRIHYSNGFANSVVFEMPPDLRNASMVRWWQPPIRTIEEWHRDLLDELRDVPSRGAWPKEVPVYGIVGGAWHGRNSRDDELFRLRNETGLLLGRNTWKASEVAFTSSSEGRATRAPDFLARKQMGTRVARPSNFVEPRRNLEIDVRGTSTDKLEAHLRQHELTNQILIVSMGDEIHVGGYDAENKKQQEQFRDYLTKLRALSNEDRVKQFSIHTDIPEPSSATLTKNATDGTNFYWSQLFQIDRGIDDLKARTEIVERVLGTIVFTGANYAPHPHYWPRVGQWVRLFRRHGMTMPWAEDWTFQVPEVSMQMSGYLCDVFRCAAKYDNLPIQFYTMPHFPGQTPRDLTLSFYSALAHGNKVLNFFAAKPIYEYTENYISWEGRENWKTVQRLVRDVGLADDIIWNGRVRPSSVAILLSHATDIYEDARGSSIYNFERKNLYLTLRHAGVPLDFVTEEDICEGWLQRAGIRVLYVCGDHMLRRSAEQLEAWVNNGGHLFSVAGGGFLDEYDQPIDTLKDLYGISEQTLALTEKHCFAKEGLAWLKPLDELKVASPLPALIARQTFRVKLAESGLTNLISFSRGNSQRLLTSSATNIAGILKLTRGSGSVSIIGTFPGSAYVQSAIPKRPADRGATDESFTHFIPAAFDREAQRLILTPVRAAGIQFDLEISQPLVDATLIEAPNGYAIPLANYSGKRIRQLELKLSNIGSVSTVESARRGKLTPDRSHGSLKITLPLDDGDLLVLRR